MIRINFAKSIITLFLISLIFPVLSSCRQEDKKREQPEGTPPPVAGKEMKTVTWITEAWPQFTQEDGTGVYHDLITAVFSSQGIKVEVSYAPWIRSVNQVKNGNYDMTGGLERNSEYHQSKYPVFEYTDLIIFEKGKFEWEGLDTLKDKNGAWVRGYMDDDNYRPIKDVVRGVELTTFTDVFTFLQKGRADYALTGMEAYKNHTAEMEGFDTENYEIISIASGELYFSFPLNERGIYVRDLFDKGIESLSQKEIDGIYNKWDLTAPVLDLK